jgi:hypothetical protein
MLLLWIEEPHVPNLLRFTCPVGPGITTQEYTGLNVHKKSLSLFFFFFGSDGV